MFARCVRGLSFLSVLAAVIGCSTPSGLDSITISPASQGLAVGQTAQFRIHKDKMLLQVEDSDNKEREYSVVSMTPRAERKSAEKQ